MHKYWKICVCAKHKDGELLDRKSPFEDYYIEASTEREAIAKFNDEFACLDVVVHGKPVACEMPDKEYGNG